MSRILIVEDDAEIAMLESDYLNINGFETNVISDGEQALLEIGNIHYDLILLDLMLPNLSGYEICRQVREKVNVPIIMVTARTDSIDKIRGLGLGADDYISKPFDPAELVARVKSHLYRYDRLTSLKGRTSNEEKSIRIGSNIEIFTKSRRVLKNGIEIKFPNREYRLLEFLAVNPNIVFSKKDLFEEIWDCDYMGDSATVTVHINRVREKIEDNPQTPTIIETIWGAGYRLNKN